MKKIQYVHTYADCICVWVEEDNDNVDYYCDYATLGHFKEVLKKNNIRYECEWQSVQFGNFFTFDEMVEMHGDHFKLSASACQENGDYFGIIDPEDTEGYILFITPFESVYLDDMYFIPCE